MVNKDNDKNENKNEHVRNNRYSQGPREMTFDKLITRTRYQYGCYPLKIKITL